MSWTADSDYGLIEFSLRGHESIDSLTIKFELTELNGTRGNWKLEIPIDLKEIKEMTTRLVLDDQKTSDNGVGIHLKEVQFAPSSNEIMYDTYFTAEEKAKVEAQIQELENAIGNKNILYLPQTTVQPFSIILKIRVERPCIVIISSKIKAIQVIRGLCKELGKIRGSLDI